MNLFMMFLLGFIVFALYVYSAIYLYALMSNSDMSKSIKLCASIFWFPILIGVAFMFVLILCMFIAVTPIVVILILINYTYRKFSGKSLLFDEDKVKLE